MVFGFAVEMVTGVLVRLTVGFVVEVIGVLFGFVVVMTFGDVV